MSDDITTNHGETQRRELCRACGCASCPGGLLCPLPLLQSLQSEPSPLKLLGACDVLSPTRAPAGGSEERVHFSSMPRAVPQTMPHELPYAMPHVSPALPAMGPLWAELAAQWALPAAATAAVPEPAMPTAATPALEAGESFALAAAVESEATTGVLAVQPEAEAEAAANAARVGGGSNGCSSRG